MQLAFNTSRRPDQTAAVAGVCGLVNPWYVKLGRFSLPFQEDHKNIHESNKEVVFKSTRSAQCSQGFLYREFLTSYSSSVLLVRVHYIVVDIPDSLLSRSPLQQLLHNKHAPSS